MVTDPIADMLTRIRNAQAVGKETVMVPYSSIKKDLAEAMKRLGYISEMEGKVKVKNKNQLVLGLLYDNALPRIHGLRRISKPGRRIYVGSKKIPRIKSGYGQAIISTPSGVLSGDEARKKNEGGEHLCNIW